MADCDGSGDHRVRVERLVLGNGWMLLMPGAVGREAVLAEAVATMAIDYPTRP